jgi:hypothetical protein
MRDTEHREDVAAQPLPEQREPVSRAETEPIPVDEAGLETGDNRGMNDDRGVDGRGMVPQERDAMPGETQDTAPPVDAMPMQPAAPPVHDDELFPGDVAERLRARWRELQADFVDDPQRAVRAADEVVDEVMRAITEHRARLAGEWQGHTDTEHLRLALREYRSFVDRLLPS